MRRKFTIKDFLRISIYVNRDTGIKPLGLIAELAYQFGYGSMFGLAGRTLLNSNKAMSQFRQIMALIAASKLIKFILMLRYTPIGMLPWFSTIISFMLLFLSFVKKGMKALDFFPDNSHIEKLAGDLLECHNYLIKTYNQTDTVDDYPEQDLLEVIEDYVNYEIDSFTDKIETVKTLYDFYNFIHSTNLEPPPELTQ